MFNKNLMAVLFILTLFLTISGCVHFDKSYRGRVLEFETEKPIEDAAVVAVWYLEQYGGPAGPIAKLFDAKEAITDKNGVFEIPSIAGLYWWPFATLDKPNVIVFKPGYTGIKIYNFQIGEGDIKLRKAITKEERIKATTDAGLCVTTKPSSEDCIPIKKIPNYWSIMEKESKELGLY